MSNVRTTVAATTPAPILVSVYDRHRHLELCIEALKKNPEAKDSILYVVSDGWQHDGHRQAIEEVRRSIRTITGFRDVRTRFREINWGMRKSGIDAIQWVLDENDRVIRMEDDILCSQHYLQYMNACLDIYAKDNRIFCACGHTHPAYRPPKRYEHDVFLWRSFSSWGFATWRDRWKDFIAAMDAEPQQLRSDSTWRAFRRNRPILSRRRDYLSGNIHNDARINLHMFLTHMYAVMPNQSLSINMGMDGSGTHCGRGITYPAQHLTQTPITLPQHLVPSDKIQQRLYWTHYSILNHGVGRLLRSIGCFDWIHSLANKFVNSLP